MLNIESWLLGQKNLINILKEYNLISPRKIRNSFSFSSFNIISTYSFFSFFFQNKIKTNIFYSPKIPSPDGIFPFRENKLNFPNEAKENFVNSRIVWFWQVSIIPGRYREGLINLLKKYRSEIFFCNIFTPNTFSSDLAHESDFYLIENKNTSSISKEIKTIYCKIKTRGKEIPNNFLIFTFREKMALRLLWKFRSRFVSLEEISSYIYGKRLSNNLHASESLISHLRFKLKRISGKENMITYLRHYGYKLNSEEFEKITIKDSNQ